jgi:copper chaperone NosL
MMKINSNHLLVGLIVLMLTVSCIIEPKPIDYGKDQCHYCAMNIVDKTHASQYVTKKGKQFKFDAIECMVNDLQEKDEAELAFILVADYGNPGEMIPAISANYIISEAIKSPMGANLSGLSSLKKVEELQQKHSGEIYTWETLKVKLSDK